MIVELPLVEGGTLVDPFDMVLIVLQDDDTMIRLIAAVVDDRCGGVYVVAPARGFDKRYRQRAVDAVDRMNP